MSGQRCHGAGHRFVDESGFTLIEVLIAMLLSFAVLAAGTYGIVAAFQRTTEVTARTAASNQAEVRFEVLTSDLRQAIPCPSGLKLDGSVTAGVLVGGTAAAPSLTMCDPQAGRVASTAGSQIPGSSVVHWSCNLTGTAMASSPSIPPYACQRSFVNYTGVGAAASLSQSAASVTNVVTGVQSLTLSGSVVPYSGSYSLSPVMDANLAATPTATCASTTDYLLTAPTTTNCAISWVGVTAQIIPLNTPDNGTSAATASANIAVSTGAALRNFVG